MGFQCNACGQYHDHLPMSYGVPAPAVWKNEYQSRNDCLLSRDICIVKREQFFIKGNIELPVIDSSETFAWTVWVSLSHENLERAEAVWNDPNRAAEPPYFGWLTTQLPIYPDTLNLKTNVHTRELGMVPYVELEPSDHPLAIQQRQGITMAEIQAIAESLLH